MVAVQQASEDSDTGIRIFLDMDGVIVAMRERARAQGKLGSDGKLDHSALGYAWWAGLPIIEGAKEFYDKLTAIGTVKFLTAANAEDTGCYSGKAAWIKDFIPERGAQARLDLIICSRGDKQLLARPGYVLIDDYELNIEEWRAAGGIAIHHTGDFEKTLSELQGILAKLQVTQQNGDPLPPSPPSPSSPPTPPSPPVPGPG